MSNKIILIILSVLLLNGINAQVYTQESKTYSFDIHKVFIPSKLIIPKQEISFNELNSNKKLDAEETVEISFLVRNEGKGVAKDLKLDVKNINYIKGVNVIAPYLLPTIMPGEEIRVSFKVKADRQIKSTDALFRIKIIEPNGLNSDVIEYGFKTMEFLKPELVIIDPFFSSESKTIKRKETIGLQFIVQNKGQGLAENIDIEIGHHGKILSVGGKKRHSQRTLNSGDHILINYEFMIPEMEGELAEKSNFDFSIKCFETRSNFKSEHSLILKINASSGDKITSFLSSSEYKKKEIEAVGLISDVDKGIPVLGKKFDNKFAIIIGNEKYSVGFNSESDVPYAESDAMSMKNYLLKTLGFKEENCFMALNATKSEMLREIKRAVELAKRSRNAEIVFYYAGHGEPSKNDEPYLVPVDISIDQLENEGIALNDLYKLLGSSQSEKITVFLDACFSGGGRENGLVAARGIRINFKEVDVRDNMIILSSSQGDQKSLPFHAEKHGIFTYYLLKKLKETEGKVTYKQLYDYVKTNVEEKAIRMDFKQTPKLKYSRSMDISKISVL